VGYFFERLAKFQIALRLRRINFGGSIFKMKYCRLEKSRSKVHENDFIPTSGYHTP